MKFKTTKEDYSKAVNEIEAGGFLDQCCLIAQTVNRVTGRKCLVGCTYVKFDQEPDSPRHHFTQNVIDAIATFDSAFASKKLVRDGFTEVEFELEVS